jgi:hypothetical protein
MKHQEHEAIVIDSLRHTVTEDRQREEIEWLDLWIVDGGAATLPRVLLIGDSIARSYYQQTARLLEGKASVSRMATSKSLGDSALLAETAYVLGQYRWDVIHFNNGLHGRDYTEDQYGAAWPDWLALMRSAAPDAAFIWASSTAVRDKSDLNVFDTFNDRVVQRNAIVAPLAGSNGLPVNDLHTISHSDPGFYSPDGVHFNEQGVNALAESVASSVIGCLPAKSESEKG